MSVGKYWKFLCLQDQMDIFFCLSYWYHRQLACMQMHLQSKNNMKQIKNSNCRGWPTHTIKTFTCVMYRFWKCALASFTMSLVMYCCMFCTFYFFAIMEQTWKSMALLQLYGKPLQLPMSSRAFGLPMVPMTTFGAISKSKPVQLAKHRMHLMWHTQGSSV